MIKSILVSILLLIFITCQNAGPANDDNMVFVFRLNSSFISGSDTLQGYTSADNSAAMNYASNMWLHQHILSIKLSLYRTGGIVLDTSIAIDTCHFNLLLPFHIPNDTFLLNGDIFNSNQEFIVQMNPILVVKCSSINDTITSFIDSTTIVTDSLLFIGSPSKNRYPSNSSFDCQARSIWDMQLFDGEIYIGAGDVGENAGPIQIWSVSPSDSFNHKFTVDEEEISLFNVYDSSLLIPGIDPLGNPDHGNAYILSNKHELSTLTIPNAIHVLDIAKHKEQMWAVIDFNGYLRYSSDAGKKWSTIINPYPFYSWIHHIIQVSNTYYFLGDISQGYCRLNIDGDSLIFIPSNLTPQKKLAGSELIHRICTFKNGFVYSVSSLYYFDCNNKNAKKVTVFNGINLIVQDIVTVEDSIFVLAINEFDSNFNLRVFKSEDLVKWKQLCSFKMTALPISMELMNGFIYIGLGNRGRYEFADSASGNVYKFKKP